MEEQKKDAEPTESKEYEIDKVEGHRLERAYPPESAFSKSIQPFGFVVGL